MYEENITAESHIIDFWSQKTCRWYLQAKSRSPVCIALTVFIMIPVLNYNQRYQKIKFIWDEVGFFTFVKKITNHRKVIWNWRTSPWNCRILNVAEKWNNFKTRVRLFGFHREQHIRLFGSEREAYIRVYWWVLCMKYIYIVVPNAQTFLWKLRRYYAIVPFFQNDSYSLWPFLFFRAKDTWVNTLHVCYVAHVITKTQQMS